ncbi:MAG: hypothetical protein LH481_10790 [Burkholderiales bacterium]|nr:hypothetical protein [Burkholderiales bacterium]
MPHLSLHAIQHTPTQMIPLRRAVAFRGLALLVLVAIALQAFVSMGSRIATRMHFHLATSSVQKQHAGEAHDPVKTETDADAQTQTHSHPHAHSHPHIASHEHSVESDDVVYVDTQKSELPSGQATNRVALDLDGLLLHRYSPSVEPSTNLIFAEHTQRFRSRVEPPLERPPRVDS